MRTFLALLAVACLSGLQLAGSPTEAYRFDPEKVETGLAYFYLKSNIDGTRPSNVAHYIPDENWIESLKWNDAHPGATLVLAKMNWKTFSVGRFEVYGVDEKGNRNPRVVLTEIADTTEVSITMGDRQMTSDVGGFPWHSYDFDYASLVHTLPHLIDPEGSIEVGRVDLVRGPEQAFKFIGMVTVEFVGNENRHGTACRKYRVNGEGLENRGGDLWIDRARGHLVDYEIDLPDEPGFETGKLKLVRIEKMSAEEWLSFTKTQGR